MAKQQEEENGALANLSLAMSHVPPYPRYHTPEWELLSQGAEARIWVVPNYLSFRVAAESNDQVKSGTTEVLCKERFFKSYRHPQLNVSLTKSRLKAEVKCLTKARKHGIAAPRILGVDLTAVDNSSATSNNPRQQSMCIFMEYLSDHITVKQHLQNLLPRGDPRNSEEDEEGDDALGDGLEQGKHKKVKMADIKLTDLSNDVSQAATAIGTVVANLHTCHLIHGDLTTSNMLMPGSSSSSNVAASSVSDRLGTITLIDFGLGQTGCTNPEEKAVDLYVLERALISSHPGPYTPLFLDEVLRAYKRENKSSDSVLSRLYQVRLRGRKRECFG
jgi:TP53 regulating kinase-like protein